MTSTIRTLKDFHKGFNLNSCYGDVLPPESFINIYSLRIEAIKWVREIDNQYQFHHHKSFGEVYANITDGMNPEFRYARVWIMRFFNITEEDLKDDM